MAVTGVTSLLVIDGTDHPQDLTAPRNLVDPFLLIVDKNIIVVGADRFTDFVGIRRLEDNPLGVKYPYPHQLVGPPHHLEDNLNILGVTGTHGVEDTALYGIEKKLGTFPGGIEQLRMLPPETQKGEGADTEDQEADEYDYDPGRQAREGGPSFTRDFTPRWLVAAVRGSQC
jgi:hypothetical protein